MYDLLCTIGSAGDVHPLIWVGRALIARGHRATVVTNPVFEELARRHGLDFAPLGTSDAYARVQSDPDLWHPTRGFGVIANRMLLPNVEPLYNLIARHDPAEMVVFAAGTCFGARVAQDDRRIPDQPTLRQEVDAWATRRNAARATIAWQFTTADARRKLTKLYPTLDLSE